MKKNYDVGIVGCWYWGNYGSILNGYATHETLKSIGLSPLNIVSPYNGFEPHAKKFFEVAYKDDVISPVLPFERVHEYNDICDTFLTGSDQIWNYKPGKNTQYDEFFRLNFADDSKKKVSYATSFGAYRKEPDDLHDVFKKLYSRYSNISVREAEGVEILKKYYNIDATQLAEPVLVLDKDYWYNLAEYSNYHENEQYLLTYILDPTPEKRKAIEFYSKKLGLKAVNILDGFSGIYERNRKALDLPNTLPNIWCADFLKYFSNASFVITDSFHGVCFAAIFNKTFIAIGNKMRGMSRFESLLKKINMENRLVSADNIPLEEKYLTPADFNYANSVFQQEKEKSLTWLKNAMEMPVNFKQRVSKQSRKRHVNEVLPQVQCMGCGACVSACPVNAIRLTGDEYGVYRAQVDEKKCIHCGKCSKVCAAVELPLNRNDNPPKAYAFISSDPTTRRESSSGGAFTALAKTILRQGGVVVGAAWNEEFTINHILIDNERDLPKLQKSKYFQSYMGDVCGKIKVELQKGKKVLFCGTPCQIAGLKKFIGKDNDNLILVDLLCANCPSASFFKKYLTEHHNVNEIEKYDFRYKSPDDQIWDAKKVKITLKNGETKIEGTNDYLQITHACGPSLSSQCMICKYQGNQRLGDLTIGDCWGIQNYDSAMDVSMGVSVILVNNHKGKKILEAVPETDIGTLKEIPLEQVKKYNVLAFIEKRNWPKTKRREKFLSEVQKKSFTEAKTETDAYMVNVLTPKPVQNFRLEGNKLRWDREHSAKGYIVEQLKKGKWERIARIGDANTVELVLGEDTVETAGTYQIKAFNLDGGKAFYSEAVKRIPEQQDNEMMGKMLDDLLLQVKALEEKIAQYQRKMQNQ